MAQRELSSTPLSPKDGESSAFPRCASFSDHGPYFSLAPPSRRKPRIFFLVHMGHLPSSAQSSGHGSVHPKPPSHGFGIPLLTVVFTPWRFVKFTSEGFSHPAITPRIVAPRSQSCTVQDPPSFSQYWVGPTSSLPPFFFADSRRTLWAGQFALVFCTGGSPLHEKFSNLPPPNFFFCPDSGTSLGSWPSLRSSSPSPEKLSFSPGCP